MKRCGMLVCGGVAASLLTLGCEANKPEDNQEPTPADPDYTALAPAESPEYGHSYDESYDDSGPTHEPAPEDPGASGDGDESVKTHVVRRKDTLYSIARAYYDGDHTKWRLIYEANQERIADPNLIYVGQRLIIPPL